MINLTTLFGVVLVAIGLGSGVSIIIGIILIILGLMGFLTIH